MQAGLGSGMQNPDWMRSISHCLDARGIIMIIKLGSLPEVSKFTPDHKWKILQEPSVWGFQLRALPIGIVTTVVFIILWIFLTPVSRDVLRITFPPPILPNLVCIVGVIVIHELLHAFAHPKCGSTKETIIGFWLSRLFVYTTFTGELSRRRIVGILLTPFIIISIITILFSAISQIAPLWLAYSSVLNALLSCGDILAAIMIISSIPKGSISRSKGWTTFYMKSEGV
jgi:hypothetical protein